MSITNLASFFFHQIREAEHEAHRVFEPMIGIVTDNKDPDKLMRVKVKLPALSEQDTTFWIPIVSYGAGKERGWFFLPEVNDEVLVAFEHGDMNRPVVIGAMWNGNDKPPKTNSGSNPIRTLVSKSGSKIEFDDDADSITISDGGGKGEITIKAGDNKMTLEAKSGDVVIAAPAGDLLIAVAGDVELKGSINFDIRASQACNVESGGAMKIEGSGMLSISGSQTSINDGSSSAATASTSPADVPDPVGG